MTRRESGPMDVNTAAGIISVLMTSYSAWLTSIVFAYNGMRPLLIAGAAFFPVGAVMGSASGSLNHGD